MVEVGLFPLQAQAGSSDSTAAETLSAWVRGDYHPGRALETRHRWPWRSKTRRRLVCFTILDAPRGNCLTLRPGTSESAPSMQYQHLVRSLTLLPSSPLLSRDW